jgi:galactokinase
VNRSDAIAGFAEVFRRAPERVVRAPGRVNLIGEHTDYNDGFVLPAAIEFTTWTAIAAKPGRTLRVYAGNRREEVTIDLDDPGRPLQGHWSDYVRGVAAELEQDGMRLSGADVWFAGDVPDGAGLSSSAALEMSVGFALLRAAGHEADRTRLALAGQRAEHKYAGTKCGIMDQFISAHGEAGRALLLDCRSLERRMLALPANVRMVICDTGVKHALAGGEYNIRRAQCEEGVAKLSAVIPGVRALRDVTPEALAEHESALPNLVARRCRHVVSENARVIQFADALSAGRTQELAGLMAASHASLRDDYQVSCDELDLMVELAAKAPGIIGARMTGGGFGGCVISLVEADHASDFKTAIEAGYQRAAGRPARVFISGASAGVAEVPED